MIRSATEAEVRTLTSEFVNSDYCGAEYADWPIERRLDRFLRRRGLLGHPRHGDMCRVILERLMTHGHGGSYAAAGRVALSRGTCDLEASTKVDIPVNRC